MVGDMVAGNPFPRTTASHPGALRPQSSAFGGPLPFQDRPPQRPITVHHRPSTPGQRPHTDDSGRQTLTVEPVQTDGHPRGGPFVPLNLNKGHISTRRGIQRKSRRKMLRRKRLYNSRAARSIRGNKDGTRAVNSDPANLHQRMGQASNGIQ